MKNSIFLSLLTILFFGCQSNITSQYHYQRPKSMNDGLEVGSLPEVNIDSVLIIKAINNIYSGKLSGVHSMLIYKDGKLVLDEYFQGNRYQWDGPNHHGAWTQWHRDSLHELMSASKSIASACIGIAIDKGFIDSVQQSIFDYLPDHQHLRQGGKENITIEHLVSMRAGLEWKEWSAPYSSAANPAVGIWFQQEKDPISFILEMPLVDEPGTRFNYSTGNMYVLGEILRNASGLTIDTFSVKHLFEPLGVDTLDWYLTFGNGVWDTNSLKLSPRSMVKFGVTFLNKGIWKGQRIISEQWVEKSAMPFDGNLGINVPGEASGKMGYSYTWWTKNYKRSGKTIHLYTASGWGGQHIMVLPEVKTVVVFTGGNFVTKRPPFKLLEKYIIPAIN